MTKSQKAKQDAELKNFLVYSQTIFGFLSLIAAFVLALLNLPGVPWFLATGILMCIWASVSATNDKISPREVLNFPKYFGFGKSEEKEKDKAA